MTMPFAILVVVGGLLMLVLATWLSSRNDEDDLLGKIIWSCVQIMSVMVILFGGYATYSVATHPPKPPEALDTSSPSPSSGSGSNSGGTAPNLPTRAVVTLKVLDGDTGLPVTGAKVVVQYHNERIPQATGVTDATGSLTLLDQPVGAGCDFIVMTKGGYSRTSNPGFVGGANQVKVTLPAHPAQPTPPASDSATVPPQPRGQQGADRGSGETAGADAGANGGGTGG